MKTDHFLSENHSFFEVLVIDILPLQDTLNYYQNQANYRWNSSVSYHFKNLKISVTFEIDIVNF